MAKDKEIRVYFCPRCKSTSIRYIFGFGNVFGVIPRQKCQNCGLEAPAFPILVTSSEKLARESKRKIKSKSKKGKKR